MVRQNHSVQIITSDSNHGSDFDLENRPTAKIVAENVRYTIIKTFKYRQSASVARVISWFDFDLKLFLFFSSRFTRCGSGLFTFAYLHHFRSLHMGTPWISIGF